MVIWQDFSGAPALLLARSSLGNWHGTYNARTGALADLDLETPATDYDRACRAAWPGVASVSVGSACGLALYSEDDVYAWLPQYCVVASGGWVPDESSLQQAQWGDAVHWSTSTEDLVLLNSAANAADDLRDEDLLNVRLQPGDYLVEFAFIQSDLSGWFHRFTWLGWSSAA